MLTLYGRTALGVIAVVVVVVVRMSPTPAGAWTVENAPSRVHVIATRQARFRATRHPISCARHRLRDQTATTTGCNKLLLEAVTSCT